jgi:hypothetical protein
MVVVYLVSTMCDGTRLALQVSSLCQRLRGQHLRLGDPPCQVQLCGLGAGRRLHLQLRVRGQRKGAAGEWRGRCACPRWRTAVDLRSTQTLSTARTRTPCGRLRSASTTTTEAVAAGAAKTTTATTPTPTHRPTRTTRWFALSPASRRGTACSGGLGDRRCVKCRTQRQSPRRRCSAASTAGDGPACATQKPRRSSTRPLWWYSK